MASNRIKKIIYIPNISKALVVFSLLMLSAVIYSQKINGVNLMAQHPKLEHDYLKPIKNANANWVSIVIYIYGSMDNAELGYSLKQQQWGESLEGLTRTIHLSKLNGLKIMLKPSVWFPNWGWPGDYLPVSKKELKLWEENYTNYIVQIAKICETENVELLCFATEYKQLAINHPEMFVRIISAIKKVYNGKLTYAANWDSFTFISFWSELDLIGVDAYFPLSENTTPTVNELIKAWEVNKQQLYEFSNMLGKPVIFTEFGYKSVDGAMGKQWLIQNINIDYPANHLAQQNGYTAIFETFWNIEDWFKGGFIWNWQALNDYAGGINCNNYTPQNKPALTIIKNWYKL